MELGKEEMGNEVIGGLQEESDLYSEEAPEVSEIDEETLEEILEDMMTKELLKEYGDVEEEIEDKESPDSEVEEEEIMEESIVDVNEDADEEEVMADEEAAILDRLTDEIAAEVEDEVAEEIDRLTKETVRELAEEIAEEILVGMEEEGTPLEEEIEAEESEIEADEDDELMEYLDNLDDIVEESVEEGEEDNGIAEKRDGEYPFGAWEDEINNDLHGNEIEDEEESTEVDSDVANEEDEDEESVEVNWEDLQYLYGPYLEELKEEYFEKGGDEEGEDFNEIYDNLESFEAAEKDGEITYPDYSDQSEDVEEQGSDYGEDEDEALGEALYEEAVEEAIKELEDEAAEAAKELVDEMLVELVEEEREKEMLEQQKMQEYEETQECSILDSMVDNCQVIDLYEGLGDGGYKEAFTGPCNRHQLCYICASTFGVSAKTCDEIFVDEMFDMCSSAVSRTGSCEAHAGYFLKAAKNTRRIPEPNSYLDYVCRTECVYNALLQ
ncbi:probable inactive protein kinase DDB_G0270444 [Ptychodera flava]|uniref:probable inactive protein kinase DDB_G0270444 n=1 Tax=Ptychodera flava TaxID=63121 RepID=UPI00396A59D7